MTFHLSHLAMMNDSGEGLFILNRFYTDSIIKQKLKEEWDTNFYPSHIPFVLSTIATNKYTQSGGSLPMWKMYGNDFCGALIRFKFKKLKDYCIKSGLLLNSCKYKTVTEANQLIADFNRRGVSFEELLLESCLTKQIHWKYEEEWRVIAYSSKDNIKVKATQRGLIEYIELKLPVTLIEEICLGPLTTNESIETLTLLRDKLESSHPNQIHFKIGRSTLSYK